MSADNNEISKEENFILNAAKAIKSKFDFEILGYGSRKLKNIFDCLVKPEKYGVDGFKCMFQLAQRMKHEFGGCRITSVSELIILIREIGYCNWPSYWGKKTNSEEFLNSDDEKKEIYRKRVKVLRNFWGRFLFHANVKPYLGLKSGTRQLLAMEYLIKNIH